MAEPSLCLRLAEKPSSDIFHFLEQTAWGSKGLQYYVKNYEHALGRLPDPRFYTISESGRLLGTVMFFEKQVIFGDRRMRCLYLTQLSVRSELRGRGLAGRLVGAVTAHAQSQGPERDPVLVTAYIEEANAPSLAVFKKQGFLDIGRFHGTVINRLNPKLCPEAAGLQEEERAWLLNQLSDLYAGHTLADFDTSLKTEEYRVIHDGGGRIVAGLQGHLEEWHITQMGGTGGWLFVNGLGKIRWVQDHLFNPSASRYIHIGNLYTLPGHEGALYRLIEDTLAKHRVPFAVGYFDQRSPVFQRFKSAGSFGLLNLAMETPVRVMGWTQGLKPQDISALQSRPLLISALDIS